MDTFFTLSNSTEFLGNQMKTTHHSGADNCSQIWGLIYHACYDVIVTYWNNWKAKTQEISGKLHLHNGPHCNGSLDCLCQCWST